MKRLGLLMKVPLLSPVNIIMRFLHHGKFQQFIIPSRVLERTGSLCYNRFYFNYFRRLRSLHQKPAQSDLLRSILRRINGKGYNAAPSRMRVLVPQRIASFPPGTYKNKSREIALRDYLTRMFFTAAKKLSKGSRGTGKSGLITIDRPGQEVLERTSAFISDEFVEARFLMGLPARGRSIAGREAEAMFFEELPRIVESSLLFRNLDEKKVLEHVETVEDADYLRGRLAEKGLIAFVANGAILPRASGVDRRPLEKGTIVKFESPVSLRTECDLPNRGTISGMGIPEGVTLIIGGGYHGKSTLLNALELGVYNHTPGDGRELVVSDPDTVKIRAEDGRRIEKVNISPFITNLPFGRDTVEFTTDDASGSTSQAANIIEAVEIGAKILLLDEDTSATNFMIRDHRMQELVSKDREPITPFIDKVKHLYEDQGVSTILVIGGAGDYFDIADRVICMIDYLPSDVSAEAQSIAEKYRTERKPEGGGRFEDITPRRPLSGSFDPRRGKREVKISPRGLLSISFGIHEIDLGAIEQLVDVSQTRAIGDAIQYATRYMDGKRTLREVLEAVMHDIEGGGLDVLSRNPVGDYALFRKFELATSINRLRTLNVKQR
jgi:predicted ABC-class ATPase